MSDSFFTIGMAGHIDHGKTTLTKALTNIDTDRLKEERERKISIELGYAPFDIGGGYQVSIIDVPGHEKFIRQMIAGVAGIDFVILVVAADEGVMPQTREHALILSYLGVKNAVIAVTKCNRVDEEMLELVESDIRDEFSGTTFSEAPMYFIDSLSGEGIDTLKEGIINRLPNVKQRDSVQKFRMPIDQAFTLKGKGAIVRGTIFEGTVHSGEELFLLPSKHSVRVRQLQVHKEIVDSAYAGQRAAINLGGISSNEIQRGNILSTNPSLIPTKTIDIVLQVKGDLGYLLKQRSRIKFHTGTSEIMGTIVYFDRNELSEGNLENILCQIRLDEPVAVLREDRFIIRRPSPVETIGGGWILDPQGEKYKFGKGTIKMLQQKMEGTMEERIADTIRDVKAATILEISGSIGASEEETKETIDSMTETDNVVYLNANTVSLKTVILAAKEQLVAYLDRYHQQNSMRLGPGKAEVLQSLKQSFPVLLVEHVISHCLHEEIVMKIGPSLKLQTHQPSFPKQWEKRMQNVVCHLSKSGIKHEGFDEMCSQQGIPAEYKSELEKYLIETNNAITLEDGTFIHWNVFKQALEKLYEETNGDLFNVQDAKAILDLSRKYCILFLEKLDALSVTSRVNDQRKWVNHKLEQYLERE
ncbi:selenocysteine-specific translation elongation factor [Pseudalkalibacillus berkeleyi]|uniref:Selenocysteine-specific elongation factor n=1 Tax=Pseudalkalibacillus berkeleyi TaxID=1069813 RepID=A0ABS9H0F2_9BACL|nr:selenocysteine-specific translation elongation factor [Pseudalkalibacillus berkeleyi]MCF6137228.1 selenocysteine-specific translation elongation factor [Pseudalkalibacillus berkeleyi]